MRSEENSLGWFVKNSVEDLLQGVRATGVIRSEGTVNSRHLGTMRNSTVGRIKGCMVNL